MKKYGSILFIAILIMALMLCFVACKDKNQDFDSLDVPKNIAENGTTISWDVVENAQSYEVIVDDKEPVMVDDAYFDMGIVEIGTYVVKIRAYGINKGKKKIYSEYATYNFVKSKKLDKPQLTISQDIATWSAVEGASSYRVVVSSGSKEIYNEVITALSYKFDDETKYSTVGKYLIAVVAIPEDTQQTVQSNAATAYYCVTEDLTIPQLNSITSTSIRWGSITGATSYCLRLYFDVPNSDDDEFVGEYKTASNSYTLASFDFTTKGEGKYYVLVKAVGDTGDDPVYFDSAYSTRNKKYDLTVISDFDENSLKLEKDAQDKWWVSFSTNSIANVASYTISLKTMKADGSSSLSTLSETMDVALGDYTRSIASAWEDGKVYYVKNEGYYVNVKPFDENEKYFIKNGEIYEEQIGLESFAQNVVYYVYDLEHYEEALTPNYIQVDKNSQFILGREYFIKDGDEYIKVEDKYRELEQNEKDNFSYNGVYYVKNGDKYEKFEIMKQINIDEVSEGVEYFYLQSGIYRSLGNYSEGNELYKNRKFVYRQDKTGFDNGVTYYKKVPFNAFEDGVTYYVIDSYKPIESFESGKTYYTIDKVEFKKCIDDLFYSVDKDGKYSYTKDDNSYYGKKYVVTVAIKGKEYNIIVPQAQTCSGEYVSYKVPVKADKTVAYIDAPYKSYFNADQDKYNAFVEKYDGYYVVESIGDLQYVSYKKNEKFVLICDLDGINYVWAPIAELGASGVIDGNNHMISNIVFENPKDNQSSAFVISNYGTIENLYLMNVSAKMSKGCEKLSMFAIDNNGVIKNCFAQGKFDGAKESSGFVHTNSGTILSSQAMVDISGAIVGGFVVENNGTIKDSISKGKIEASEVYAEKNIDDILDSQVVYVKNSSNKYEKLGIKSEANLNDANNKPYSAYYIIVDGDINAGGFVVKNNTLGKIEKSTSVNDIVAKAEEDHNKSVLAGGFVAENVGEIKMSHSGGKFSLNTVERLGVLASGSISVAGGFVGENKGTIEACYSTSRATAATAQGGFVGDNSGTISYSYSTGGISEQTCIDKGVFVGKNSGTISKAYFYNAVLESQNTTDIVAQKVDTFAALLENLSDYGDGKVFAKIGSQNGEVVIANVVYVDEYSVTIKPNQSIIDQTNAIVVIYNEDTQEFDSIDIVTVSRTVIGNNKDKGNALSLIESEDGEFRAVIYLTIA